MDRFSLEPAWPHHCIVCFLLSCYWSPKLHSCTERWCACVSTQVVPIHGTAMPHTCNYIIGCIHSCLCLSTSMKPHQLVHIGSSRSCQTETLVGGLGGCGKGWAVYAKWGLASGACKWEMPPIPKAVPYRMALKVIRWRDLRDYVAMICYYRQLLCEHTQ